MFMNIATACLISSSRRKHTVHEDVREEVDSVQGEASWEDGGRKCSRGYLNTDVISELQFLKKMC